MPRGLAHDHEAKRAALRKGAAAYFAEHGYDRASMAGAAAACGVSKALVYHYYDGKEDLLFDILDTHLSDLLTVAEAVGDGPDGLRNLIRALLSAYRDADDEHKLQTDALDRLPSEARKILLGTQHRLIEIMEATLVAITPDLPQEKRRPLTMSVFGMLNWYYMWQRPGRGMSRSAYGDFVADLVLGGIRAV